jgi:hypothetical protein
VADYTPVYLPGAMITVTTSGAVVGGDILVVSGSGTVAKNAGASSTNYVGIAAHDAASGARVTMYGRGTVHESIADGAVTAGDQLVSSSTASRQVKTTGAVGAPTAQGVTDTRAVMGIALTTAADNAKVRWMAF